MRLAPSFPLFPDDNTPCFSVNLLNLISFLLRTNQLAKNAVSPLKVTVAFAAQLAAALTAVFVASCAMVAHNMVARL